LRSTTEFSRSAALHVAVVIVSYKSAADIAGCLRALELSTYPDFRVVVCENGGPEAYDRLKAALPARLAAGQPVEVLLAPDNLGYAGGINFCVDNTGPADAYWILNPDTEPDPAALASMVDRLLRMDCGAVGHDIVLSDGRLASRGGGRWAAWTARAISINHGGQRIDAVDARIVEESLHYIVGASMLVTAAFFERVGPLREDYFLYCEEVEWFLRAALLGERLGYAPDAVVLHAHGAATGASVDIRARSRTAVYLGERNRLLVTRDYFPSRLLIVACFMLLQIFLRYVVGRAWRQAGYALSGWLAGLRDERGKPRWMLGEQGVA